MSTIGLFVLLGLAIVGMYFLSKKVAKQGIESGSLLKETRSLNTLAESSDEPKKGKKKASNPIVTSFLDAMRALFFSIGVAFLPALVLWSVFEDDSKWRFRPSTYVGDTVMTQILNETAKVQSLVEYQTYRIESILFAFAVAFILYIFIKNIASYPKKK